MAYDYTDEYYGYTKIAGTSYLKVEVLDRTLATYGDMQSAVLIDDYYHYVTDLSYCFANCENMTSTPTLSTYAETARRCFFGCISLTDAGSMPELITDMSQCFAGCSSLLNVGNLPSECVSLEGTFIGCTSLVTCPALSTSNLTSMRQCFSGCRSFKGLRNSTPIPSTVTDMTECFKGCTSLGSDSYLVTASNNPTSYDGIFAGTSNDIYINPRNLSASAIQTWRTIAAQYQNVHYWRDDVVLSARLLLAQRCASTTESTLSEDAPHCYFRVEVTKGGYIPPGASQTIDYTMRLNGEIVNAENGWQSYSHGLSAQSFIVVEPDNGNTDTSSVEAWYEAEVTTTSSYVLSISDGLGKTVTLAFTLAKVGALIEAYHGNGGEGLTIGTLATAPGFNVAMDTYAYGERDYPLFTKQSWSASSSVLSLTTTPCFVLSLSDFSLWYCDASDQTNPISRVTPELPLSIANGGTGANTAAGARSNLGALAASSTTNRSANLNNMVDGEVWWGDGFTNAPDDGWYRVIRIGETQIAFRFTGNDTSPRFFIRSYVNNTWQPWAEFLQLSGGTMTGPIYILNDAFQSKSTVIDIDGGRPSSNLYRAMTAAMDKDGEWIAYLEGYHYTNGNVGIQMVAHRKINGSDTYNVIAAMIDESGNKYYVVDNPANFRSAIDAAWSGHTHSYLPLSGGTMTGTIYFGANSYISPDRSQGNCDSTNPAIYSYNTSSSNRPYNTGYGHIVNIGGNDYWKYQIAFPTYGNGLMWRCNINNGGWSAWRSTAEGHDGTRATAGDGTYNFIYTMNTGDRLNYLSRANDYLHISTWNYGNYGVTWWSSDIRLKENIADSEVDALEIVNQIQHRSFDMKSDGEHHDIGYIAQELEKLDPQMVTKVYQTREVNGVSYFTGDYTYQIDERKVIPYLSKSIQQLSAENEELKRKNAELESRLEAIERKLGL